MSWLSSNNSYDIMSSGASGDIAIEAKTIFGASACTLSGGEITFPTNTSATPGTIALIQGEGTGLFGEPASGTNNIIDCLGRFRLSALPSSGLGFITNGERTGGGSDRRYAVLNTSGQIEIYDAGGTLRHTFTGGSMTTGATALPYRVVFDTLTIPGYMIVHCAYNNVWQTPYVSGIAATTFCANDKVHFGELLPDATARGADLIGKEFMVRYANAAFNAPHREQYPDLRGVACGVPAAAGTDTAFTGTFADVDDFPNDGDTTYIEGIVAAGGANIAETHQYTAANPLSGSETIWAVHHAYVGRRLLGGTKKWFEGFYRFGGSSYTSALPTPGTSHVGNSVNIADDVPLNDPTDFDLSGGESKLEFGFQTTADASFDSGGRVTNHRIIIVYYSDLLSLAPSPLSLLLRRSPSRKAQLVR